MGALLYKPLRAARCEKAFAIQRFVDLRHQITRLVNQFDGLSEDKITLIASAASDRHHQYKLCCPIYNEDYLTVDEDQSTVDEDYLTVDEFWLTVDENYLTVVAFRLTVDENYLNDYADRLTEGEERFTEDTTGRAQEDADANMAFRERIIPNNRSPRFGCSYVKRTSGLMAGIGWQQPGNVPD